MRGHKTSEMEVDVPVADVWDLYGSNKLARLMEERLPALVEKIDIDGDGGIGTILHIHLTPGMPFSYSKEKIAEVDHQNHVKVEEVFEGGFLSLGYRLFRLRYEIIEKDDNTSIIRSITEYEVDDEIAAIVLPVSNDPLELIAQTSAIYLLQKKFAASRD